MTTLTDSPHLYWKNLYWKNHAAPRQPAGAVSTDDVTFGAVG